jgi:hypothetical protein
MKYISIKTSFHGTVLCVALFTLLVLFWTRTQHLPSLPPISPNCYLPKSGRHVTSLDQGLSTSEARSGKSLGTRLRYILGYLTSSQHLSGTQSKVSCCLHMYTWRNHLPSENDQDSDSDWLIDWLIDLRIVLTHDCWHCFLVFNIWVSHALDDEFLVESVFFMYRGMYTGYNPWINN